MADSCVTQGIGIQQCLMTLNIPHNLLCHSCLLSDWFNSNVTIFTLHFEMFRTACPKDSKEYGAKPAVYRVEFYGFWDQKLPNFWRVTAVFAISYSGSLWCCCCDLGDTPIVAWLAVGILYSISRGETYHKETYHKGLSRVKLCITT